MSHCINTLNKIPTLSKHLFNLFKINNDCQYIIKNKTIELNTFKKSIIGTFDFNFEKKHNEYNNINFLSNLEINYKLDDILTSENNRCYKLIETVDLTYLNNITKIT